MQRLKIIFNEVETKDFCMVICTDNIKQRSSILKLWSLAGFQITQTVISCMIDYDLLVLCFNKRDFMVTYCLGRGSTQEHLSVKSINSFTYTRDYTCIYFTFKGL